MTIEARAGVDRSVRPAVAADAERIARLQVASIMALTGNRQSSGEGLDVEEAAVADQWRRSLTGPKPDGFHTLVALHGHGIAGFAFAAPGDRIPLEGGDPVPAGTDIHELAVDPDFARSGHGSRLLQAIVDTTDARCLRVWISPDDEARVRFYQSAGFAPAPVRRSLGTPQSRGPGLVQQLWWATR